MHSAMTEASTDQQHPALLQWVTRAEPGVLAGGARRAEQNEVEQYFASNYLITVPYHNAYWIGYQARTWGPNNFIPLDRCAAGKTSMLRTQHVYSWTQAQEIERRQRPHMPCPMRVLPHRLGSPLPLLRRGVPNPTYRSWGWFSIPGLNNSEPNNMKAPELCAVANYTTAAGVPSVWGWADTSCLGRYASICKILRESCRLPEFLPSLACMSAPEGFPCAAAAPAACSRPGVDIHEVQRLHALWAWVWARAWVWVGSLRINASLQGIGATALAGAFPANATDLACGRHHAAAAW
jgi:hypothetical protein